MVLQLSLFLYAIGVSFTMVQAQVQALEPFPTRAGTAAGLMGSLRSAMTCAVAVIGGAIHSHTPRPTCTAICILGFAKLLVHLALRPSAAVSPAATSTAEMRQGNSALLVTAPAAQGNLAAAAAAEEDPTAELRQAHEAAMLDVTAAKAGKDKAAVAVTEVAAEAEASRAMGGSPRVAVTVGLVAAAEEANDRV